MAPSPTQLRASASPGLGTRATPSSATSTATVGSAATLVDYDNDGWLDLVVAAKSVVAGKAEGPAKLFLFRNDGTGRFLDRSTLVPASVRAVGASAIAVSDVDDDGDEDLWLI